MKAEELKGLECQVRRPCKSFSYWLWNHGRLMREGELRLWTVCPGKLIVATPLSPAETIHRAAPAQQQLVGPGGRWL